MFKRILAVLSVTLCLVSVAEDLRGVMLTRLHTADITLTKSYSDLEETRLEAIGHSTSAWNTVRSAQRGIESAQEILATSIQTVRDAEDDVLESDSGKKAVILLVLAAEETSESQTDIADSVKKLVRALTRTEQATEELEEQSANLEKVVSEKIFK